MVAALGKLGRDLAGERCGAGKIGILLGPHRYALCVIVVDDLEHIDRFTLILLALYLEVRDDDGNTRFFTDMYSLEHGLLDLAALSADMGSIVAAIFIGNLGDLDKLLCAGIDGGSIDKARCEAEESGLHGLGHELLHLFGLFFVGIAHSEAHYLAADVALRGIEGDINAKIQLLDGFKEALVAGADLVELVYLFLAVFLPDTFKEAGICGHRTHAALAGDLGSDALLEHIIAVGAEKDLLVGMAVAVDKSGRYDESFGIDDTCGLAAYIGADCGYFRVFDCD